MRTILALTLLAIAPLAHAVTPCTTATPACIEWIPLPSATPARSMIYTSYPLATKNTAIHRALIMIHGTNRNADHYFQSALAAAFLAGALDDTVVISPGIHSNAGNGCKDALEPTEVNWSCGGDSWRSGGVSLSNKDLTSFDFIDALVRKLADKKNFPNLTQIVVAGHSAGGQFVARYQMANKVDPIAGVTISYVVANPSSYAWPDATRPLPTGDATAEAAGLGWQVEKPHTNFTYGAFDAAKAGPRAATYDKWPFGLEDRTSGYTVGVSDDQLKKQLATRKVTYLLSQVDTLPLGGFDSSANAMAQGATRRARGEAFVKYIHDTLSANPTTLIIPECGHNDRCVYTTDAAFPYIFPKP